jgi:hypothetical protein
MNADGLDRAEMAAWVRLASVLELLPGVLDAQLRRDANLMHFEYWRCSPRLRSGRFA